MRFTKFQGFGNDYIVFEADQLSELRDLGDFARHICNRHYGAGADGIAVGEALADDQSDFRIRIFNPDGSEAGMSGNGSRCAAAYLFFHKLWTKDDLRLQTRNGVKRYHLLDHSGGSFLFRSELGQPKFDSTSIPMKTPEPLESVIRYPLVVDGETLAVTALQMGNPNCCVFVSNFDDLDWRRLGPLIENHPQFPERTNVIFIRVRDRANIEERIWERGVGETESSGTCSCGADVAWQCDPCLLRNRSDQRRSAENSLAARNWFHERPSAQRSLGRHFLAGSTFDQRRPRLFPFRRR